MKMVKVVFLAALAVVFSLAGLLLGAPGASAQSVERGEIRGVRLRHLARHRRRRESDHFQSFHGL